MSNKKHTLPRRTFLRGLGGAILGLPVLDIMLNTNGDALALTAGELPRHYAVILNGQSLGADNDSQLHRYYAPNNTGFNYDLTGKVALEALNNPFSQYAGADPGLIKSAVSVVSNLSIPVGDNPPPGGRETGFHASHTLAQFCGRPEARRTSGSGHRGSSDQIVADYIRSELQRLGEAQMLFNSLVFCSQPAFYLNGYGSYGREQISMNSTGAKIAPQMNPANALNDLFQNFSPPQGNTQQEVLDHAKRKSVIDLVRGDITSLMRRLGRSDQTRMEQHLEQVREIERRINSAPITAGGQCQQIGPYTVPAVGAGSDSGDGFDIPVNVGYSGEDIRSRIFMDLIHMAFVCDMTRVASLVITQMQSHMNVKKAFSDRYGLTVPNDVHELGHSGGTTGGTLRMNQMIAWHVDLYAYLLAKLKSTPEGAGSVLDRSCIILCHEGGHGVGYEQGNSGRNTSHSTDNMCALVAGGAGGLQPGQHVRAANGTHAAQVMITGMKAMGAFGPSPNKAQESLGEVNQANGYTGAIDQLFSAS